MKNDLPLSTRLADATIRRLFRCSLPERGLLAVYERLPLPVLLKLLPAHYSYPLGTFRTCRRNGMWFHVDIGTRNGWMLYSHRSCNPEMARYVRPGDQVLDIGANQGELALLFAQAAAPGGKVYAFEPNPAMFGVLARNIALNPAAECHAEPVALGASPGKVEMCQPDGRNPGTATVHTEKVPYGGNWATVEVMRLDDYVRTRGLARIDVMKIDVEGYEFEVCKGAEETLRRWRPRLIMELSDTLLRMHGTSADELAGWLRAHGYAIQDVATGGDVDAAQSLDGCFLNVVCRAGADGSRADPDGRGG